MKFTVSKVCDIYLRNRWPRPSLAILFIRNGSITHKDLFGLPVMWRWTYWWRLFQKGVVCTKLDNYVFIDNHELEHCIVRIKIYSMSTFLIDICLFVRLFYDIQRYFQQYFSYIVAVSVIGGRNWRTRRKQPTCRKSLTNLLFFVV